MSFRIYISRTKIHRSVCVPGVGGPAAVGVDALVSPLPVDALVLLDQRFAVHPPQRRGLAGGHRGIVAL